jgi:hypothetical protein
VRFQGFEVRSLEEEVVRLAQDSEFVGGVLSVLFCEFLLVWIWT